MSGVITRWVEIDPATAGDYGDGRGAGCVGARASSTATAAVGDTFTIGPANNRLYLSMDGDPGAYITLYPGTALDPRFVAKDITEKMHDLGKSDERWDKAVCEWTNTAGQGNCFKIYSGTMGVASTVAVISGTNTVHATLGFSTKSEVGGLATANTFAGTVTVSGTYKGFFDETYKVVITNDNDAARGIGTASKVITYGGIMTTGGVYNDSADTTYTITIDITNGTTMGGGTGNVPMMTWSASPSADNSTVATELLYANHWYKIGTRGLMIKFTDAVFSAGYWTVPCYKPDYTSGTNVTDPAGSAMFAYSSTRGDMGAAATTPSEGNWVRLGTRGLYIKFEPTGPSDYLGIRDEFNIICSGPKPKSYDITSLNYGNVTVSTESPVKCVMFEIVSGAVQASSIKFGLQSHGSFSHHEAGNNDTYFRFGTVGPGSNAGIAPENGIEWYPGITAADIDSNTPPAYLYHTVANMLVVATADDSESVGNIGLTSDPIFVNIRLGASETGANSQINQRTFFDFA
jgi:hypothetical protein